MILSYFLKTLYVLQQKQSEKHNKTTSRGFNDRSNVIGLLQPDLLNIQMIY